MTEAIGSSVAAGTDYGMAATIIDSQRCGARARDRGYMKQESAA